MIPARSSAADDRAPAGQDVTSKGASANGRVCIFIDIAALGAAKRSRCETLAMHEPVSVALFEGAAFGVGRLRLRVGAAGLGIVPIRFGFESSDLVPRDIRMPANQTCLLVAVTKCFSFLIEKYGKDLRGGEAFAHPVRDVTKRVRGGAVRFRLSHQDRGSIHGLDINHSRLFGHSFPVRSS